MSTSVRHSLLVLWHFRSDFTVFAEGGLIGVGDVEETVGVLALLIDLDHEGVALQDVAPIHEEVEGVLLGHLNALADDKRELVRGQVVGHQVSIVKCEIYLWWHLLVLVNVGQLGGRGLLTDDGNAVRILFSDLLALFFALVCHTGLVRQPEKTY